MNKLRTSWVYRGSVVGCCLRCVHHQSLILDTLRFTLSPRAAPLSPRGPAPASTGWKFFSSRGSKNPPLSIPSAHHALRSPTVKRQQRQVSTVTAALLSQGTTDFHWRAMSLLLCLFRWGIMRLMAEGRCTVATCNVRTYACARCFLRIDYVACRVTAHPINRNGWTVYCSRLKG